MAALELGLGRAAALADAAERAQVSVVDFSLSRDASQRRYIGRARGPEILLSSELFEEGMDRRRAKIAYIAELQHVSGLMDENKAQAELESLVQLLDIGPIPAGWRHGPNLRTSGLP